MNAHWQLWMQLIRRMPVLVVLANVLRVIALFFALKGLQDKPANAAMAALMYGMSTVIWHIGQGHNLRSLCVSESFLLPHFRRRLLEYAQIDVAMWIVLPLLIMIVQKVPHLPLVACGLLLIAAVGLMMGCNPRASLFAWPFLIMLGWAPSLFLELMKGALHSPLTPLLMLATTALLLRLSVTPLLRIEDRETDTSPLENAGLNRIAMRSTSGEPRRSGAWSKRIGALYDHAAQRAMTRALAAYERSPSLKRRMVLVRRLLLPHDNPEAIVLGIALVAAIFCFYVFAVMHRQHFEPVIIGGYAIMMSIARFPQLNIGMTRMRPNMADLYLTLAPETRAEYQKTVSDALLILVPISMVTAIIYTSLGAVLVHAADPWHLLFVAAIVSAAASLAALAVHLIGPEGTTGRTIVNFVVVLGVQGVYWGGYWLVGVAGYAIGGGVLAFVTLGFGLGTWFAAQREYQQRSPRFDAPIG